MARYLPGGPQYHYRTTDHSEEIDLLRQKVDEGNRLEALVYASCADLLQAHDETGISLDNWLAPRLLIEYLLGKPILENGV